MMYSPYNEIRNKYPYHNYQNNSYKYSLKENNTKKEVPKQEEKQEKEETKGEEPIIEIFGIKLYFDDLLIIALLLFLYFEGVKDEMLFISLILLLLT